LDLLYDPYEVAMNTKNNTKINAKNDTKKTKKNTPDSKNTKTTATTICISLDSKYVGILEQLAAKAGSKSAAIRLVLDEHVRNESLQELESAYSAYFAAPEAAERERALTEEMLSAARWPPDVATEAPLDDIEHPSG
jgi:hypothetical protein